MQDKNIEDLNKMYTNLNPNFLFHDKLDYKNLSYYSSPEPNHQNSSPLEYSNYFSYMNDPYLNTLSSGPKAVSSDLGKHSQNSYSFYQQEMHQEPQSLNTSGMQSILNLETILSWESSSSGKSHTLPIIKKKRSQIKSNLKNMNRRCESYICDYQGCNKVFTRPYNLKAHTKIHTQERPFICSVCHVSFSRLHDMKRHTSLHSGIKPYACPHCDKAFARLGNSGHCLIFLDALNRHIKKDKNSCSTVLRTEKRKKNVVRNGSKGSDVHDLTQFMDIPSFESPSSVSQY